MSKGKEKLKRRFWTFRICRHWNVSFADRKKCPGPLRKCAVVLTAGREERRKEERVAIRGAGPGLPNPDRTGQKSCFLPWLSTLKDVTSELRDGACTNMQGELLIKYQNKAVGLPEKLHPA